MTLQDFIQRVRSVFRKDSRIPDELIQDLIRSLESTNDEECSCGDVYTLLDQYAESEIRGEDAARLMPLLRHHIQVCNECCEEYEALLRVLENSSLSEKTRSP
ncbi:MAG TPA: hypothetical protein VGJ22_01650 [Anaerolineales bacterium]|jgi:hypothetical protein